MEPYEQLEQEFGRWVGMPNMVACNSGTAALHLALECLNLPPGSRVIVPDFTMIACARAVTLAGLEPVFVDCYPGDLTLNIDLVGAALEGYEETENPIRAVMPVHIYGRRCRMKSLIDLAVKYDLFIIEDLAEAHGVAPHPATDAACWSFYKNKIIHGEEGGAVAFQDPQAASLARELRSLGFTEEHDFYHTPRGHNYRLANALALPIMESLKEVASNLQERRGIEGWYDEFCPAEWRTWERNAVWVYDLRIRGLMEPQRISIIKDLNASGIAARHSFKPMSQQQEYEYCEVLGVGNVCLASREVFYLPVQPGETTREEAKRAMEIIRSSLGISFTS